MCDESPLRGGKGSDLREDTREEAVVLCSALYFEESSLIHQCPFILKHFPSSAFCGGRRPFFLLQ